MLGSMGFNHVWLNQGVGNHKMFLLVIKQRITDIGQQEYMARTRHSDLFYLYRVCQNVLTSELYFEHVNVKYFRNALVRFLLGVSDIPVPSLPH